MCTICEIDAIIIILNSTFDLLFELIYRIKSILVLCPTALFVLDINLHHLEQLISKLICGKGIWESNKDSRVEKYNSYRVEARCVTIFPCLPDTFF